LETPNPERFARLSHSIQVWDACDGDVDAAAEMLLSMSLVDQPRPACSRPPVDNDDAPVFSNTHDGQDWGWSVLPEECKDLTIQLLSMRDLARSSCVCRELSQARPAYAPYGPTNTPFPPLSRSGVGV
jgi:hypothetical protein